MARMALALLCAGALFMASGAAAAAEADLADRNILPRLKGEELDTTVMNTDGVWLIAVTNDAQCGEPCDMVKDTLAKAHEKAKDVISLGVIDAFEPVEDPESGETQALMTHYNITELPSMLLFTYGPKQILKGLKIDARSTMALAGQGTKMFLRNMRQFVPSDVQLVRRFALNRFLTDDQPDLPRVTLVHDKKKTPLIFSRMSLQFDRRGVFGEIQGDEVLMKRLGVTAEDLPALFVTRGPGNAEDYEKEELDWERYEGEDMSYVGMANWLMSKLPEVPAPLIMSHGDFDRACVQKGGVCFIAFIPEEAEEQEKLREVYRWVAARSYSTPNVDAGGKFHINRLPVSFAVVIAEQQAPLTSGLKIANAPAVVGINPRKKRFATFKGAFEVEGIYDFILSVMNGQETLEELDALPPVRTVDIKKLAKGKAKAKAKAKAGKAGKGKGKGKAAKDKAPKAKGKAKGGKGKKAAGKKADKKAKATKGGKAKADKAAKQAAPKDDDDAADSEL